MDSPKISVIIPTYNRAHCLQEAIDSVLRQTFKDFELIVVDDGSSDGTSALLQTYGNPVTVIQQKNQGVSRARNNGIKISRGEWVAFLDSDDLWEEDKLEIQLREVCEAGCIAHMVDAFVSDKQNPLPSLFKLRGLHQEFKLRPIRKRPLCDVLDTQFFTSTWLINRKVIERAGYFDNSLKIFEDIDLLARIALDGPFVISCYPGTNMRRLPAGESLSTGFQTNKSSALSNLIKTYETLKRDERLTSDEYRRVCKSLSGARSEIAALQWRNGARRDSIMSHLLSLADDPGFRSIGRLIVNATGTMGLIERLSPIHRKRDSFRRSKLSG